MIGITRKAVCVLLLLFGLFYISQEGVAAMQSEATSTYQIKIVSAPIPEPVPKQEEKGAIVAGIGNFKRFPQTSTRMNQTLVILGVSFILFVLFILVTEKVRKNSEEKSL